MKNLLGVISLLVLLLSCNSKTKKDDAEVKEYKIHHKIEDSVGVVQNGQFIIADLTTIQMDWEAHLKNKGKKTRLTDFKIVKGITEGDSEETYYLLCATSADRSFRTAALLRLENEKFYFESPENSQGSYSLLICEGLCTTGCDPVVKKYNDTKYLNCSSCTDCRKNETEIR